MIHKCPICKNVIADDKWIGPDSANIISIACNKCAIRFQKSHYAIKNEAVSIATKILDDKKKRDNLIDAIKNSKIGNLEYPIDENYLITL